MKRIRVSISVFWEGERKKSYLKANILMAIKVYAKGRSDAYEAFGVFDGKKLTVKKGSRISEKKSDKIQPIVTSLRNDTSVVSSEYILLKDVTFRSPSTAASFY